jgi:hypothetical protein
MTRKENTVLSKKGRFSLEGLKSADKYPEVHTNTGSIIMKLQNICIWAVTFK